LKIVGIICEYNPFHLGHEKQIRHIRTLLGPDTAVVCLMSGNFVQRGAPAVFDKSLRAKAALLAGADLVLELPIPSALSSAEGFAAGGVQILGPFCDYLCFGCETGDTETLMATARALLAEDFPAKLHAELDKGLSFPAARQAALGHMGALLENPNDILAVEYCKAILSQGWTMEPLPIRRRGSYHATEADHSDPSATAIRNLILADHPWSTFVPHSHVYDGASVHAIEYGEKAILYRLRTMTDTEFETLPYGSEGLWRKLMHAARSQATLEQVITATKSKRYTRTRIDRMILCATLGITADTLRSGAPYSRVLALNDTGRRILKTARQTGLFPNIGEAREEEYQLLERRADDLYALFTPTPDPAGTTDDRRVFYRK
jgi:predicted nucleotidyltransferase